MNSVNLIGRLTRDPEIRVTNGGDKVASFTLALNRNYNSADGQQADYINCVGWKKTAELIEKYVKKGHRIGAEGRLRSRTYDNAQGQKTYVVEVVLEKLHFLESKQKQENYQPNMNDVNLVQDFSDFNIMEDDIGF